MADVIDISAKRAPVVYSVTIAHHYDGTLEFNIQDVADDERSREAVLHAFRRISGADSEIEKLTADLKRAVWSDSEECKIVGEENEKLRARIAELEENLADEEYVSKDTNEMFHEVRDENVELRARIAELEAALREVLDHIDDPYNDLAIQIGELLNRAARAAYLGEKK